MRKEIRRRRVVEGNIGRCLKEVRRGVIKGTKFVRYENVILISGATFIF